MIKLKTSPLLSLLALFMMAVIFTVPVSAHDGHGGAPGHLHQVECDAQCQADLAAAADEEDSLPDVDKECAKKGEDTSFGWGGSDDCAKVNDLVSMVFKVLAGIVGVAVVGGIAWGGMLYTTSNGNASKAQQGITTIVNAIIGLLLFIFMFALTNFIVPGGIL